MASRFAHRTRATFAALAVAALALTGCSSSSEGPVPGEVDTVDDAFAGSIDEAVEQAMQLSGSSEAVVGMWSGDDAYVHAYGDGVDANARIRMAQSSQPIMCALLLDLADSGSLSLDDKVSDSLTRQPGIEDVTWAQLCNMKSGIADFKKPYSTLFADNPTRYYPTQELISQGLTGSPLAWPGLNANQSDTNLVLLARALMVHTRESIPDLLKKRVFEPAGMSSSYYPSLNSMTISGDRLTETVYPLEKGKTVCDADPVQLDEVSPSMLAGAGATVTTVSDLKNFYEAYLDGSFGGDHASVIDDLTPDKNPKRDKNGEPTTEPDAEGRQWSFGMEKMGPLFGRAGAITGTISAAYHDPESDFTVIVALNNSSAGAAFSKAFAFKLASIASETGLAPELPWSQADQDAALKKAAVCQ